jgi:hypothetical protein
MAYSKAKLKSNGDRASPCFRPFWIGYLSDKCLPTDCRLIHLKESRRRKFFPVLLNSLCSFMKLQSSFSQVLKSTDRDYKRVAWLLLSSRGRYFSQKLLEQIHDPCIGVTCIHVHAQKWHDKHCPSHPAAMTATRGPRQIQHTLLAGDDINSKTCTAM